MFGLECYLTIALIYNVRPLRLHKNKAFRTAKLHFLFDKPLSFKQKGAFIMIKDFPIALKREFFCIS